VSDDVVQREELRAAAAARAELGDEMEPAVIDAFVERIERRLGDGERALQRKRDHQKEMVLGAMALSIPFFAIAAIFTGLAGVIVVCSALVLIAVVTAR
jgi:hypothetical protein